jgi:hypothetical protein
MDIGICQLQIRAACGRSGGYKMSLRAGDGRYGCIAARPISGDVRKIPPGVRTV